MALTKKEKEEQKEITLKYKIRLVIDIEGQLEGQTPLKDDTGIYPMIEWAIQDIEQRLKCDCDLVGVKKVELEEVET